MRHESAYGSPQDPVDLPSLKAGTSDYVAAAAKAALGAVPFAGSLLAEVAGSIIPNQRVDRLVRFSEELEKRLARLDHKFIRSQLTNENFTDLLEESLREAARSVSDERRSYLAAVVASGLSPDEIEFFESKHLIRILGDINDVEVLILRAHLVRTLGGDEEFREKHKGAITQPPAYLGSPREDLDKHALHESYKTHLVSLGLLKPQYRIDSRTRMPEFDTLSGGPKLRGHEITQLGRLLLRQIGLSTESSDTEEDDSLID